LAAGGDADPEPGSSGLNGDVDTGHVERTGWVGAVGSDPQRELPVQPLSGETTFSRNEGLRADQLCVLAALAPVILEVLLHVSHRMLREAVGVAGRGPRRGWQGQGQQRQAQ
jgi:hypothetical protein